MINTSLRQACKKVKDKKTNKVKWTEQQNTKIKKNMAIHSAPPTHNEHFLNEQHFLEIKCLPLKKTFIFFRTFLTTIMSDIWLHLVWKPLKYFSKCVFVLVFMHSAEFLKALRNLFSSRRISLIYIRYCWLDRWFGKVHGLPFSSLSGFETQYVRGAPTPMKFYNVAIFCEIYCMYTKLMKYILCTKNQ